MVQGIGGVTSLLGMFMSIFSMGNSTVSQYRHAQALNPPAQVQRCPTPTTPQIQRLADGSYRLVCVQTQAQGQQP